jgi:polyisoprenoid-binding protein YceI
VRKAKGTVHVFTFKEGVLSRAAHDLRLTLGRFEIRLDGEAVEGELHLDSLKLDGPVRDGVVHPEEYGAGQRADVERAMHGEILHTAKNPVARFHGQARPRGDGFTVSGELDLAGKTAPLGFDVENDGGTYRARIQIQPSRWGIAQYKALLGAIRLRDAIRVDLALTESPP